MKKLLKISLPSHFSLDEIHTSLVETSSAEATIELSGWINTCAVFMLILTNNLILVLEGMNGISLIKFSLSDELYSSTFAPCLVFRSFLPVMKMQFAKFSFEFDPTQVIKCLPACHSAILYILRLSALLGESQRVKAAIWFSFGCGDTDSLRKVL